MVKDEEVVAGPQVTIYTSNDCHWCGKAKEYLTANGFTYSEKNVEEDEAFAREAMSLVEHRGTPIIVVGSQVIQGFRREQLDLALGFTTN